MLFRLATELEHKMQCNAINCLAAEKTEPVVADEGKKKPVEASAPPTKDWPSVSELNTRLRRLVTMYQKHYKHVSRAADRSRDSFADERLNNAGDVAFKDKINVARAFDVVPVVFRWVLFSWERNFMRDVATACCSFSWSKNRATLNYAAVEPNRRHAAAANCYIRTALQRYWRVGLWFADATLAKVTPRVTSSFTRAIELVTIHNNAGCFIRLMTWPVAPSGHPGPTLASLQRSDASCSWLRGVREIVSETVRAEIMTFLCCCGFYLVAWLEIRANTTNICRFRSESGKVGHFQAWEEWKFFLFFWFRNLVQGWWFYFHRVNYYSPCIWPGYVIRKC